MKNTLVLLAHETKTEFIKTINGAIQQGVPFFVIESMLTDLLMQVKDGARLELSAAIEQLEKEKHTSDDEN